jgi:carbon-monoxide dehydrogenase large subunit
VRVITGQVGGSFGMKAQIYPNIASCSARTLKRPVNGPPGSFVSDHHGRAQDMTVEIAFDENAHILAVRVEGFGDMGGYLGQFGPLLPTGNIVKNVVGVYRTPLLEVSSRCVFTNTTLVSAYRGAGRPEGNYYMERALDLAASELGLDRIDLRKRNMIKPRDLPFKAASDMTYDCGDFPAVLKQALEMADYKGFAKRAREQSRADCGIGIGCYLEVTFGGGKGCNIHFERMAPSPSSPLDWARATPPPTRRCSATSSAFRSTASA